MQQGSKERNTVGVGEAHNDKKVLSETPHSPYKKSKNVISEGRDLWLCSPLSP